jgi:hypothetical protein
MKVVPVTVMVALVQAPPVLLVPGVTVLVKEESVPQLPAVIEPIAVAPGKLSPPVHISPPTVLFNAVLAVSQQRINPGWMLEAVDLKDASFALFLAEFRLTNTILAKIPIIAITIKSSIRVKPFFFFLFAFFFFIIHPPF